MKVMSRCSLPRCHGNHDDGKKEQSTYRTGPMTELNKIASTNHISWLGQIRTCSIRWNKELKFFSSKFKWKHKSFYRLTFLLHLTFSLGLFLDSPRRYSPQPPLSTKCNLGFRTDFNFGWRNDVLWREGFGESESVRERKIFQVHTQFRNFASLTLADISSDWK